MASRIMACLETFFSPPKTVSFKQALAEENGEFWEENGEFPDEPEFCNASEDFLGDSNIAGGGCFPKRFNQRDLYFDVDDFTITHLSKIQFERLGMFYAFRVMVDEVNSCKIYFSYKSRHDFVIQLKRIIDYLGIYINYEYTFLMDYDEDKISKFNSTREIEEYKRSLEFKSDAKSLPPATYSIMRLPDNKGDVLSFGNISVAVNTEVDAEVNAKVDANAVTETVTETVTEAVTEDHIGVVTKDHAEVDANAVTTDHVDIVTKDHAEAVTEVVTETVTEAVTKDHDDAVTKDHAKALANADTTDHVVIVTKDHAEAVVERETPFKVAATVKVAAPVKVLSKKEKDRIIELKQGIRNNSHYPTKCTALQKQINKILSGN